jgi:biotin carboxyl carrier protein
MKLRVDQNGESHVLTLSGSEFTFDETTGYASVEEIRPGVYSVLFGAKSFRVNVAERGERLEVVTNEGTPRLLSIADTRDRVGPADSSVSKGPAVIRAQMPGKIVKLLVAVGETVEAGQGLIVVEAMKMQNEVKAPKSGTVTKILTIADATVAAGETLIVLE